MVRIFSHLGFEFTKNFFISLWKSATTKILLVMDILGLILSLFPDIQVQPKIILFGNIIVILIVSGCILINQRHKVLFTPKAIFREHTYHVNSIAISPNGDYLLSCGGDRYAILWDLEKKDLLFRMPHNSWVAKVGFSPIDPVVYSLSGKEGVFNAWEINERRLIFSKRVFSSHSRGLSISNDGHLAVLSSSEGSIALIDPTEKNYYSPPFKISDVELRSVTISTSGLIAVASIRGEVFLIEKKVSNDKYLLTKIFEDPKHEMIRGISFNKQSTLLAIVDSGGWLKVLNIESGKFCQAKAHNGQAISVVFLSDISCIATGGQDKRIRIWKFQENSLKQIFEIEAHVDDVTCLEFGTNTQLFSASRDKTIKIWNLSGLQK
jgi:WD40 repeat protein